VISAPAPQNADAEFDVVTDVLTAWASAHAKFDLTGNLMNELIPVDLPIHD